MSAQDVDGAIFRAFSYGAGVSLSLDEIARALSALAAAGYAVVPREPTQRMLYHAWDHGDENARDVLTAMIAAAAKEGEAPE